MYLLSFCPKKSNLSRAYVSYILLSEAFTRGVSFHRFYCLKEAFRETISLSCLKK